MSIKPFLLHYATNLNHTLITITYLITILWSPRLAIERKKTYWGQVLLHWELEMLLFAHKIQFVPTFFLVNSCTQGKVNFRLLGACWYFINIIIICLFPSTFYVPGIYSLYPIFTNLIILLYYLYNLIICEQCTARLDTQCLKGRCTSLHALGKRLVCCAGSLFIPLAHAHKLTKTWERIVPFAHELTIQVGMNCVLCPWNKQNGKEWYLMHTK